MTLQELEATVVLQQRAIDDLTKVLTKICDAVAKNSDAITMAAARIKLLKERLQK